MLAWPRNHSRSVPVSLGNALEFCSDVTNLDDQIALLVPALSQHRKLRLSVRLLLLDLLQAFAVIDANRTLAPQDALLHFQVIDLPNGVFDSRGRSVLPQR